MTRKRTTKHTHGNTHNEKDKGVVNTVKETTEKAFDKTKDGVSHVVEGVKNAFD